MSAMQLDGFFACEAGNAVAQAVEAGAVHDFSLKIFKVSFVLKLVVHGWGEYVVAAVACFI